MTRIASCVSALVVVVLTAWPSGRDPSAFQGSAPAASRLEQAYRASNLGVARLEQFDFDAAAASFRESLALEPSLAIARVNLAIALLYAGQLDPARKEAETAAAALPDTPQPHYVLGLIAKAQDRPDDAIAAFRRVLRIDAGDAATKVNLGQMHLQQRDAGQAATLFKEALAAEPYNVSAAYGAATALLRAGQADAGRDAMQRFQTLRDSAYAVTYAQNYLQQGRYAEAIVSTGAEPGLVDERTPQVAFSDVTPEVIRGTHAGFTLAGSGSAVPKGASICSRSRRTRFGSGTSPAPGSSIERQPPRSTAPLPAPGARRCSATTTTTARRICSSCARGAIACCTRAPAAPSKT
jgi:cytochrome c-type biogenesis protein CcmH/NrfG